MKEYARYFQASQKMDKYDHQVLKIIGAYTGRTQKDLLSESVQMLVERYDSVRAHLPPPPKRYRNARQQELELTEQEGK